MPVEPIGSSHVPELRPFRWDRLPRAVGQALDARKILLAAAGLVLLAAGWGGLDRAFPASAGLTPTVLPGIFPGPSGGFDPMETAVGAVFRVAEPAVVLIRPFAAIFAAPPEATAFLHALLASAWGAAVWGLVGGAIARIALVQASLGERLGVGSAIRFALRKWAPLAGAPLSPLIAVFLFAIPCALVGLLFRVPGLGAWLGGALMFIPLLAALVMAVILLGLAAGWPLMHATIAAEGEDGFDALSRSYAYVNGRPARYAVYLLLAWGIGAIGLVFVDLFTATVLHLARWGLSLGTPALARVMSGPWLPGRGDGPDLTSAWVALARLVPRAWAFSYFWTATGLIYLLMRQDVDGTPWHDIDRPGHSGDASAPEGGTSPAGVSVPEGEQAPAPSSAEPLAD